MMRTAREVATTIARMLREAGFESLFAGGCVRDELLGEHPKDYDVATNATPEQVASIFHQTREVGKAFGVVQVRMHRITVEVATFRRERGYSDKRRPDQIEFTTAEEDAQRRDFTINALFIDPLDTESRTDGRVIDYVNGLADLKSGIIRAVGNPDARLEEDHLRALRAVRFAARLAFQIEPRTAQAIRAHARELKGVSRERIGEEMKRMMLHPSRAAAAELMTSLELDAQVLERIPASSESNGALNRLPPLVSYPLALSAWVVDRHGDLASRGFRTVPPLEQIVRAWRSALCLSNYDRDHLLSILSCAERASREWSALDRPGRKRLAASAGFTDAMTLLRAASVPSVSSLEAEVAALAAEPGGLAPLPLVTGDDLISIGFCPGHELGAMLDRLYNEQLDGRLANRNAALELAQLWREPEKPS